MTLGVELFLMKSPLLVIQFYAIIWILTQIRFLNSIVKEDLKKSYLKKKNLQKKFNERVFNSKIDF